jgi:hypothetical protein
MVLCVVGQLSKKYPSGSVEPSKQQQLNAPDHDFDQLPGKTPGLPDLRNNTAVSTHDTHGGQAIS